MSEVNALYLKKSYFSKVRLSNFISLVLLHVNFRIQMMLGAGQYAKYQPMPWIGVKKAKRGISSYDRWDLIRKDINGDAGTVLDIGANVGFFSIQLALEGHTVIAVDFQKNLQLIFEYAARRAGVNNVGYMTGAITPENIFELS